MGAPPAPKFGEPVPPTRVKLIAVSRSDVAMSGPVLCHAMIARNVVGVPLLDQQAHADLGSGRRPRRDFEVEGVGQRRDGRNRWIIQPVVAGIMFDK